MKHIDRKSRPPGSSTRLHSVDFEILRNIIQAKSGIFFQNNKQHILQSRIMPRLTALSMDYFEDYVDFIIDPANFNEVLRMIDAVTPTDTAFFRSSEQFDCIENQILPTLFAQHKQTPYKQARKRKTLRIWSAACATGEEAFSLAMIVHKLQDLHPGVNIEIVASDINTNALYIAECGVYNERAISQIPPAFLEKHCYSTAAGYKLAPEILDMVTFKRINLANRTDMMRMHEIDLIVCANVLHSFMPDTKLKTLQAIYNCMNDEGYLIIGESETLFGLSHPFLEINIGGSKVYQKCA